MLLIFMIKKIPPPKTDTVFGRPLRKQGVFFTKGEIMFEGILSDKEFIYSAIGMLIIGLALHKYRKKG